jgi:hypothetical protein
MPKMNLSHFEVAFLSALLCSIVLAVVTRKEVTLEDGSKVIRDASDREKVIQGARYFGYFMAALFGVAWLMKLGHG